MSKLPYAVAALLGLGALLAAVPNAAELLPESKAFVAYVTATDELSTTLPEKTAERLNRTLTPVLPADDDTGSLDPVIVPPQLPSFLPPAPIARTTLTKREPTNVCEVLSETYPENVRSPPALPPPAPEWPSPPEKPSPPELPPPLPEAPMVFPSDSRAGCLPPLGNWTAPYPLQFFSTNIGGGTQQLSLFKSGVVNLWLNATRPVYLESMRVALVKVSGATETPIYEWAYTPSTSTTFAPDPESDLPLLLIHNQSVPITLSARPTPESAQDMKVLAGDRLSLRVTDISTVSGNFSKFNETAGEVGTDLLLEFGSLDRLSSFSAYLEPTSLYANSAALGMFIADDGKLSFAAPNPKIVARSIRFQWALEADPETGRIFTENVTLGAVTLDDSYTVLGNALVHLYLMNEGINEVRNPLAPNQPVRLGATPTLRMEVELLVGDRVITTNEASWNPAVERCGNCNPQATINLKVLPLATAGLDLPKGATVTLQARFWGSGDDALVKPVIFYGGSAGRLEPVSGTVVPIYTPAGLKLPAILEGQTISLDLDSLPPPPPPPNGGAGVTNGTYSMETNKLFARAATGGSAAFDFTVRNRNTSLAKYELKLDGLPKDIRAATTGFTGSVFPQSFATARAIITIPAASPLGSLEFNLNGTFETQATVTTGNETTEVTYSTPVGPLKLTLVVDEVPSAAGGAPKPPGAAGPDTDVGGTLESDRLKVISQSHQQVPGFEAILVLIGLGLGVWTLRRRSP